MKSILRRSFLTGTAGLASLALHQGRSDAIDPFRRTAPGRMQLSLAAYSLRDKLTKGGWDLFKFVDYCHEQGLAGAELTSYYFPADVTTEYLVDLKQHCHRRGVTISGGAIRNDFCQTDATKLAADIEHTKKWIDYYAILGAPVIRIFAGNQPKNDTWGDTVARCVRACETVCEYAHKKGVYLGLENHGGVTAKAEGLLEIVSKVQAKSFGINFDSGNFSSTDDPYRELEQIAPYAVNAQLKVEITTNGKKGETDLKRVVEILRKSGYSGWVALEYEAKEEPLEAIPKWLNKLRPIV